jgi:septal ring factor EnvC (AmiA/AmiB activator)
MNIEFTKYEQETITKKEAELKDIRGIRTKLENEIESMKEQIRALERGIEEGQSGLDEVSLDFNNKYQELEKYVMEKTREKMRERFS